MFHLSVKRLSQICAIVGLLFGFAPITLAENKVTSVSTAKLGDLVSVQTKSYAAAVVSENIAKISAKINAEITSLPLRVGDKVTQDQTIARLDCDLFELEVEASKAALDLAAEDLGRIKALKNKNVVSAQQYTAASVAQRQSNVMYKQARLRARYCDVKAPFTGVITKRFAALGDFAAAGMPLVELVQTDKTEIKALLPVDVAIGITNQQNLLFKQGSAERSVTLRAVLPVIDEVTKTQEARFSTASGLVAGGFGRLTWKSAGSFLPSDMIQRRNGQLGVFIIENNRAVFHPLPNAVAGKPATVDLDSNTLVVTTGRHSIENGQSVNIR